MSFVFQELLKCIFCGVVDTERTERMRVDDDIDGKKVICCSDDCQEHFYYKKRNYWRALRQRESESERESDMNKE